MSRRDRMGPGVGRGAIDLTDALLAPDEPPPYELRNPAGVSPVLLVCDHATNRVPHALAGLGLAPELLAGHIAWDPGAAEVARRLSVRLDAPLILGGYSRLVIDLNRPLASPESIPERSDGVIVPGNLGLSEAQCERRISALFRPYHAAITRLLDGRGGRGSLLVSIHSFTPVLGARSRPWHVAVACGRDPRLAKELHGALSRSSDLRIGFNQPYDVDDAIDYTLPTHGEGRGIQHAMIELRQDGLVDLADIGVWAGRLEAAIRSVLA